MSTDFGFRRRDVLAGGAALAVAVGTAGRATASPQDRAQALVAQLSGEVLGLINAGRPEAQLYSDFERVLARYGDMPAVAATVLGPPWRGANGTQREAFVAAFAGYLARKYGSQFRDWQQAQIGIQRVRDAGNAGVLVETVVTRPGQQPIAVGWQVSERSGRPKVVNLLIEGISMVANERAEIGALLEAQRGSIDGLVGALRGRG
jgi:phospholipid transport system substrate-binding protein